MVHCQPVMEKRVGPALLRNAVTPDKDWSSSNLVCSRLNLECLGSFEVVEKQFQTLGVTIKNALALQPSNAAYPTSGGETLLMAAPRDGWMEFVFNRPIRRFNCRVTSSQPVVLSAYDARNNLIAQDELAQANLADSDSYLPPNSPLRAASVWGEIARITLYAFDGQLTVSEANFCC